MDMLRKRNLRLCIAALTVNLVFIWGNSLLPGHISAAISHFVRDVIAFFFPGDGADGMPTGDGILRKTAHVLEFCSLGFLLSLLLKLLQKPYLFSLPAGILVGAVDECIQLITPNRGPHIRDVGIDTLGIIAGIGIFTLVLTLRKDKHKNLEENKQ